MSVPDRRILLDKLFERDKMPWEAYDGLYAKANPGNGEFGQDFDSNDKTLTIDGNEFTFVKYQGQFPGEKRVIFCP